MSIIAWGLEVGHPFAYFLIFMLLYPPMAIILMFAIEWIISKIKRRG